MPPSFLNMGIVKQAVKHTGKARKEEIVAELVNKMDNSKALVFTDYKGITHVQLESLKKELKKMDSTIVIAKNSLIKISLGKSKNFADFKDNENLNLPTATLFVQGDYVGPLKQLQKSSKEFGLPKIKFGILEGQALDEAQVLKIASLPGRETLLTQLVGTLNSPIQGLVVTLNGTIQKFVMTLGAIAANKPAVSEATPTADATTPEETPVEKSEETNESSSEPQITEGGNETPAEETPQANEETNNNADEKSEGGEN